MNGLLGWLLGLDHLDLASDAARLGLERPPPTWAWPGIVAVAVVIALWSYRRLDGARSARAALGTLRALTLITLAVLIAGPRLVEREQTVERDWVLALVDRSASLSIADAPAPGGSRRPREAQLRDAISSAWPALTEMMRQREVVWLGFDAGAYDLPLAGDADAPALALGAPTGRRTDLNRALEQALQRAAARPLAGVIVVSDGRSIAEPSRAVVRRLQAGRVPVIAAPLGSVEPVGDLAVRSAVGPGVAFVGDLAPVRVEIDRLGAAGSAGGTLRLIDSATGMTLDEARIEPGDSADEVILTARPQDAGDAEWLVRLDTDEPDLIEGNNTATIAVELIDRPLRALYIDGVARWEQRYLKNLLLREQSVTSSNLILAPNRRYLQEGDVELSALPVSPEEWAEFDVVILGDVRPEVFTDEQLQALREHIAVRGGGIIWIGGPGATPDAWRDTPLADLIPFTGDGSRTVTIGEPVVLVPTAASDRLGVLRLGPTAEAGWPPAVSDPAAGWSQLRWAQRITPDQLKPATEILAVGVPVADLFGPAQPPASPGEGWPLVLSMRFGAGRSLYVATDEIWRWRFGRGEALPERFWLQMVRLLARESLSRSQRSAILALAPRRPIVGEPARLTLELLDEALVELDLASIAVRVERRPSAGESADEAETFTTELTLRREPDQPRRYAGTWAPPAAGAWRIEPIDSALAGLGLGLNAQAALPDDELRRPETDHALLAALADATGGRVVSPDRLAEAADLLPNRQQRIVHEQQETLWDSPLAMLVLLFLLTLEWVGRRIIRLI